MLTEAGAFVLCDSPFLLIPPPCTLSSFLLFLLPRVLATTAGG